MPKNIRAVEPVGYLEMVWLEANCKVIATDSSGVQNEAYFHQKPYITLRDETEWVELLECSANQLIGSNAQRIMSALGNEFPRVYQAPLYGIGTSGDTLIKLVMAHQ